MLLVDPMKNMINGTICSSSFDRDIYGNYSNVPAAIWLKRVLQDDFSRILNTLGDHRFHGDGGTAAQYRCRVVGCD